MRYFGIALGAITALVATALLTILGGSFLASTSDGGPGDYNPVLAFLGAESYLGLARVLGGIVAGAMAWKTRQAPWIIGAGAAAGFVGSVLLLTIGFFSNMAAGSQLASAADLLPPLLWTLGGAIGGALAWVARPRTKR